LGQVKSATWAVGFKADLDEKKDYFDRDRKQKSSQGYRFNVLPIGIPPLHLRRGDISSLVRYLVERKACEMRLLHTPQIDSSALERLTTYDWPGECA
jgi:transcriptional regulator with GAF, ATPase, and Fis domain